MMTTAPFTNYGFCPSCGARGIQYSSKPLDGIIITCERGHAYPVREQLPHAYTLGEHRQALDDLATLRAQRDELLAACKEAEDWLANRPSALPGDVSAANVLRAAIAKTESP